MAEWLELRWSTGTIDEARRVCRYLIQERIAASAKIIPWVETIYLVNDTVETGQESHVEVVIPESFLERVQEVIVHNSTYEVPEITWRPLQGGNAAYLEWLNEGVTP